MGDNSLYLYFGFYNTYIVPLPLLDDFSSKKKVLVLIQDLSFFSYSCIQKTEGFWVICLIENPSVSYFPILLFLFLPFLCHSIFPQHVPHHTVHCLSLFRIRQQKESNPHDKLYCHLGSFSQTFFQTIQFFWNHAFK